MLKIPLGRCIDENGDEDCGENGETQEDAKKQLELIGWWPVHWRHCGGIIIGRHVANGGCCEKTETKVDAAVAQVRRLFRCWRR